MQIIIIGAGMVGTQLARHLIQEKHDVSVIEANEEKARHLSNHLDCMVLHDEGNNLTVLEEAGIAKAHALVCLTDSDELNMIICGLADSRYPDVIKIARVRNDEYVKLNKTSERVLGIDFFVHPDVEASRSVLSAIERGAMGDILAFSDTCYELGSVDIAESSVFDGLALPYFRAMAFDDSLITLVERNGESILPTGATVLQKGDRIHVLADGEKLDAIFELAGEKKKSLRKIGIVGGGRLGVLIAEALMEEEKEKSFSLFSMFKNLGIQSNRKIVIIEKDYEICKELAARFPKALVLNEDISDESFVAEERIDDLDLIITTTENQELNMIAAIYLKSCGVGRTIAMVISSGYAAIARQLGLDVVIPMKSVVVDSILSHLMGSGVKDVHRIGDGSIGIIEIEIYRGTPIAGKSLTEFKLTAGGLVLLIKRKTESFIPTRDYVFTPGDRIVLIAKNGSEIEIEKLFG
jgi:trk system potassium uptake protein TrkA